MNGAHRCLGGCGKYIAEDKYYCLSCASILGKDIGGIDNGEKRSSGVDSDTESEITKE